MSSLEISGGNKISFGAQLSEVSSLGSHVFSSVGTCLRFFRHHEACNVEHHRIGVRSDVYAFIMTEKDLRMGPAIQPRPKLDCRCLPPAATLQPKGLQLRQNALHCCCYGAIFTSSHLLDKSERVAHYMIWTDLTFDLVSLSCCNLTGLLVYQYLVLQGTTIAAPL